VFYKKAPDGFLLEIKVVTRSSKSGFFGVTGDKLKVNLMSAPVKGKANKELVKLLSKKLGIPKNSVNIERGATSANKTVFVNCPDENLLRSLSP